LDRESGLMYFGARYYDAAAGSFISVDPMSEIPENQIGQTMAAQGYSYANGNPIIFTDPDGQRARKKSRRKKRQKKSRRVNRTQQRETFEPIVITSRILLKPDTSDAEAYPERYDPETGERSVKVTGPGQALTLKQAEEFVSNEYGENVIVYPIYGQYNVEDRATGKLLATLPLESEPIVKFGTYVVEMSIPSTFTASLVTTVLKDIGMQTIDSWRMNAKTGELVIGGQAFTGTKKFAIGQALSKARGKAFSIMGFGGDAEAPVQFFIEAAEKFFLGEADKEISKKIVE